MAASAAAVVAFVEEALLGAINPNLTPAFRVEVWALFILHASVLVLSTVGVLARYLCGGAWLFRKDDDSGLLRPNATILVQIIFSIYAICFLITVPTFSLNTQPSNASFVFKMSSFALLSLAFHIATWATAISPTTSLALTTTLRPRRSAFAMPRVINAIGIGGVVALAVSLAPPIYYASQARVEVLNAVAAVQANGVGNTDPTSLQLLFGHLIALGENFNRLFRVVVAIYLAWSVVWALVYVPCAIRLMATLRRRRRRLRRGIKSLQLLDELVSTDELEQRQRTSTAALHPAPLAELTGTPISTYRPDTFPLEFKAEEEQHEKLHGGVAPDAMGASSPGFAEVVLEEVEFGGMRRRSPRPTLVKPPVVPTSPAASSARVAELRTTLAATNRLLLSIVVQFAVALSMGGSFFAFGISIFVGGAATRPNTNVVWSGWNFAAIALIETTVFAVLSVAGYRSKASKPTSTSTGRNPPRALDLDEESSFAPAFGPPSPADGAPLSLTPSSDLPSLTRSPSSRVLNATRSHFVFSPTPPRPPPAYVRRGRSSSKSSSDASKLGRRSIDGGSFPFPPPAVSVGRGEYVPQQGVPSAWAEAQPEEYYDGSGSGSRSGWSESGQARGGYARELTLYDAPE